MGKKGHDLPKILRQELVLNIVETFAGAAGISTSEIFDLLDNKCPGINKRTLYRDLDELSLRFPIYDDEIDGTIRWFLKKDESFNQMNSLFRNCLKKEIIEYLENTEEQITEAV